jgi:hypothetical protein
MFPVPPVVPEVGHEEPLIQARAIDVIAPRPLDSPRKNDYPLKRF